MMSKGGAVGQPLRVLLVDDHTLFRKGIASLLLSKPGIEVVGETGDGLDALTKARELMPDLIFMDIRMPGMNGIEATRRIKEEIPVMKVVILTVSEEDNDLFEAVKAGAQGYLLKNLEPEDLFKMLDWVVRGEAAISPSMASKIIQEFSRQGLKEAPPVLSESYLTEREKAVLKLVAKGSSNKEVAAALGISESTAKNHLHNIMEKLHLRSRVQAAAYALRQGLAFNASSS
ncbi:MAG: response regulator transcription factor [Chloroflexota bacterium]|nr:response regulator transcription factor [Chloroflexota bacterium]